MFKNLVKSQFGRYSFEIHNIDLSVVNAIRRVILTDIPNVAFRADPASLEVLKNTGPLHNEFMLHRMSMIPIHLTEEQVDNWQEDDMTFELDVKNPGEVVKNITTQDITVTNTKGGGDTPISPKTLFPLTTVTSPPSGILITRLRPKEELHIKGHAVKGTARENAGFSPVSLCTYSFIVDPTLAAAAQTILDKERAYVRNEYGDATSFNFDLESECALSPAYIVDVAFGIILSKLTTVMVELNTDGSKKVTIETVPNGTTFTFANEDDTLGNLLQSTMHNYYVREKHQTDVTYVGYFCPHPLELKMVLTVHGADPLKSLIESCKRIEKTVTDAREAWARFSGKSNPNIV